MKKFTIFLILVAITCYQFFLKKEPPVIKVNAVEVYEEIYTTHEKEITRLYEILKFASEATPEIGFQELEHSNDTESLILSNLKYNYKKDVPITASNVLLFRDDQESTDYKLFSHDADNLDKFSIALKEFTGQNLLVRGSIAYYLKRKFYGNWDFYKDDEYIEEKLITFKKTSAKKYFERIKNLKYVIRTKSKLKIKHQVLFGQKFKPSILLIDTYLYSIPEKNIIDHSTIMVQNSDSLEVSYHESDYQDKEKTELNEITRMINLDLDFAAVRLIHEYYGLKYMPF